MSTALGELRMWKLKLARLNVKPSNGIDAFKHCSPVIFPNIHMLLQILCTLPLSTATPERMFSNLKRVKSYLRNTMKEVNSFLSYIFLIRIHYILRKIIIYTGEIKWIDHVVSIPGYAFNSWRGHRWVGKKTQKNRYCLIMKIFNKS